MTREEFLEKIGNRKLLFFDTETTGLYAMEKYAPNKMEERDASGNIIKIIDKKDYIWDEMIEIGYILYDPITNENILSGEHLLKCNKPISDLIYGVTGISQDMVNEKGLTKQELYEILGPIIDENPILVAYNTKFDITFIYQWLLEIDEEKYKYFNFDVMDVMTIYANYFPFSREVERSVNHAGIVTEKKYGHRLVGAIQTLCHRELKQTHRALDDIEETIVAFKELEKLYNVYDFINILGYHPSSKEMRYFYSIKPFHVTVLPLGYNGNDYVHQLANNVKPKEYAKFIIPKWIWGQDFVAKLKGDKTVKITEENGETNQYEQIDLFEEESKSNGLKVVNYNGSRRFRFVHNR